MSTELQTNIENQNEIINQGLNNLEQAIYEKLLFEKDYFSYAVIDGKTYLTVKEHVVNIPLSHEKLPQLASIISEGILSDGKIFLSGSKVSGRWIEVDRGFFNKIKSLLNGNLDNNILYTSGNYNQNGNNHIMFSIAKNNVEEIFVAIMIARGVPIEEWKIKDNVCIVDNLECRENLGNGTILQESDFANN